MFRDEETDSSTVGIKRKKVHSVYDQERDSIGLAVFVTFETSKDVQIQSDKIFKQLKDTLSEFCFARKYINMVESAANVRFDDLFDKVLLSVEQKSYRCFIAFFIGDVELSTGKLCYMLKENNCTTMISHEKINKMINSRLSKLKNAIPAIVFHTWISTKNPTALLENYLCPNTFFCYASNNIKSLPQGVHPHQLVCSMFEVLKESHSEPLMLLDFYADVREHYLDCFPPGVKSCYNANTTLYTKNTLQHSLMINFRNIRSRYRKCESSRHPVTGLFFCVISKSLMDGNENTSFVKECKQIFETNGYTLGKDIIMTNEQTFSKRLKLNAEISRKCSLVFILTITTGNKAHHVQFADGAIINENQFAHRIGKSFPNLPKILFFSELIEATDAAKLFSDAKCEHLVSIQTIEPNLSVKSLISNFASEIRSNFFSEFHTILQSTVFKSSNSFYIQKVSGLFKDFYFNSHEHLAELFKSKGNEFTENYKTACKEGTESFNFFRLMIVGPEGVGKTSLLRALTGQTFREDEKSTEFLNKYDLQVHKFSHNWSEMENFSHYFESIEDIRQNTAMKKFAKTMFQCAASPIENDPGLSDIQCNPTPSSFTLAHPNSESIITTELTQLETYSIEYELEENFDYAKFQGIYSVKENIQTLSHNSEFFTVWDFAGQNYLYCFHSLFLSPRSVYLLLIDLTVKDLTSEIESRHREDRHDKRSKSGVPRTYLEVYEFWLNAIYSISKTASMDGDQKSSKIIPVFSKADQVENAKDVAKEHLKTIQLHMYHKNNSFNLVYQEDELLLLSCKGESEYFHSITKLKATIKELSDELTYKEPVPIKWLKLANIIQKKEESILDKSHIQYLAETADCSDDLEHILHFFNEIGLFFYQQGKIIIGIQKFLNLIYYILFPGNVKHHKGIVKSILRDICRCNGEGILSVSLFEYILSCLNMSNLREPILELLQHFGIIIKRPANNGISNSFYVPYLLTGSLTDSLQSVPPHNFVSSFFVYFPDGFLPASIYFSLLAKSIQMNEDHKLPLAILGFDCAIFFICESLFFSFDFCTDRSSILVSFFSVDSMSPNAAYITSEILHYLIYLQLLIVEIQKTFLPSSNIAKVMFECNICKTLSHLKEGEKPTCSLDIVFFIDENIIISALEKYENTSIASPRPKILGRFCCKIKFQMLLYFSKQKILLFNIFLNLMTTIF